jgi:DNA-binding Lrp family transcriptional regulator
MHLSRRSRAILLASQLKADQTIEELAESTRIPPHTLRRELNSLRERGLIVRLPFVDVFRLGFVESQLFFSVAPDKSEGSVAGLVRLLRKSWRVPWLATLGGTYQYGVTILGKDLSDTVEFLDSISPTHRAMLQDKVVNTLVSFRYLLKRHLIEEPESVPLDWVGVSMNRADGAQGRKADRPERGHRCD